MILVTGGTGMLGSHLLFKLIQKKTPVKALYRREKKLEIVKKVFSYYSENPELDFNKIEWVEGDITDIPSLEKAFDGVTEVYHCAAFVSFEPDKYHQLRKINIEGTANVVNLCIEKGVEKLCHVSSIAALGDSINGQPITEETDWNNDADNHVYGITKHGAEMEVWRGVQEGLAVVIVNPGVIIGPGIWSHGSGSFIKNGYKGHIYAPPGSISLIGIHDVTNCMVRLMDENHTNQRYVLVSETWPTKKFFNSINTQFGKPLVRKDVKPWQLQVAWRFDWLWHKLSGKRRQLTKQLAKTACSTSTYDNSKIKKTLNLSFNPMEESIKECCKLYQKEL
ncbi:MAG: NAD-dependent epimerase/dehydratase family protein [Flavobacteriaceae bacterium]